jgi:hypothetical protein
MITGNIKNKMDRIREVFSDWRSHESLIGYRANHPSSLYWRLG